MNGSAIEFPREFSNNDIFDETGIFKDVDRSVLKSYIFDFREDKDFRETIFDDLVANQRPYVDMLLENLSDASRDERVDALKIATFTHGAFLMQREHDAQQETPPELSEETLHELGNFVVDTEVNLN